MQPEKIWRTRRLLLLRAVVLWVTTMRYLGVLLRTGVQNAIILYRFQKDCGYRWWERGQGLSLKSAWLPVGSYLSLFRVIPSLNSTREEQKRLRAIYRQFKPLCEGHRKIKPFFRTLSETSAIRLQRAGMEHTFRTLFGLFLDEASLNTLERCGCVNCTLTSFLSYCGVSSGAGPTAPLALQLPAFIASQETGHSRQGLLMLLSGNLWTKAEQLVCRVSWAYGDARQRLERASFFQRTQSHIRLKQDIFALTVAPSYRRTTLGVLIQQLEFNAVRSLCALTEEMAPYTNSRVLEFAFIRATTALERNSRTALRA